MKKVCKVKGGFNELIRKAAIIIPCRHSSRQSLEVSVLLAKRGLS